VYLVCEALLDCAIVLTNALTITHTLRTTTAATAPQERNHVVFFDCAYQGFASGDAERDAAAIRLFVDDGHRIALGQVQTTTMHT
jgi:aspartate/tyrosine/aromatic aminotransferase